MKFPAFSDIFRRCQGCVDRGSMHRAPVSPHGVCVAPLFFGTRPFCGDYAKEGANIKIKTVDIHPVYPWVVTCDGLNNVTCWNYATESLVFTFRVEALKDSQRGAAEALELHSAFAESLGVSVPDVAGPGLGTGGGSEPGAAVGGATEAFVSERLSGGSMGGGGAGGGGGKGRHSALVAGLPEDLKGARAGTGAVRSVQFADEHVLAVNCGGTGSGRGWDEGAARSSYGRAAVGGGHPMASSVEALESALLSPLACGSLSPNSSSNPTLLPQPSWLMVMCEHRVLLLDYTSRACIDLPHASLLVEAPSGAGAAPAAVSSSGAKPSVHCGALVGPGQVLFGCEDGALRLWSASAHAVTQVARPTTPGLALTRPITHLQVFSTLPGSSSSSSGGGGGSGGLLSPRCALGAAVGAAGVFALAASSDGWVITWRVVGWGKGVEEAGALGAGGGGGKGGVKLSSGDCVGLSVCRNSLAVVALGSDKMVTQWEAVAPLVFNPASNTSGSAPFATPGPTPRTSSHKIVTSSAASEGGVGSKLSVAFPIGGGHPLLPPRALLVCGKGPHLELSLPGGTPPGGPGSPDPSQGLCFYDLRTARPGLPSKLKVYVCARHPLKGDLFTFGTNIGVFVVSIGGAYTLGAAVAATPFALQPCLLPGKRVREGFSLLNVTQAGALVVTDVCIASPMQPGDAELLGSGEGSSSSASASASASSSGDSPKGSLGYSSRQLRAAAAPTPPGGRTSITQTEHMLLPAILPVISPPATVTPASTVPGSPPPAPNVWAPLMALSKGIGGGLRGVRLRLSTSGRYLAAVWPEHKAYSIFKIRAPDPDSEGHSQQWSCQYLGGGGGVEVAWSSPLRLPSGGAAGGTGTAAAPGPSSPSWRLVERYAVLEPGTAQTGRGPMGGGMAIGSLPASSKPSSASASAPPPVLQMKFSPATVSIYQLELLEDSHTDAPEPALLAADCGLSSTSSPPTGSAAASTASGAAAGLLAGEPCALWGGALLAVAVAPEGTPGASLGGAAVATALAAASLYFFSWDVHLPGGTTTTSGGGSKAAPGGGGSAKAPPPPPAPASSPRARAPSLSPAPPTQPPLPAAACPGRPAARGLPFAPPSPRTSLPT